MKITVTPDHIAAAFAMPYTSPVALAAGDGAIANHVALYHQGKRYELPAIAVENEKEFDRRYRIKGEQGTHLAPLEGYEFEVF